MNDMDRLKEIGRLRKENDDLKADIGAMIGAMCDVSIALEDAQDELDLNIEVMLAKYRPDENPKSGNDNVVVSFPGLSE